MCRVDALDEVRACGALGLLWLRVVGRTGVDVACTACLYRSKRQWRLRQSLAQGYHVELAGLGIKNVVRHGWMKSKKTFLSFHFASPPSHVIYTAQKPPIPSLHP